MILHWEKGSLVFIQNILNKNKYTQLGAEQDISSQQIYLAVDVYRYWHLLRWCSTYVSGRGSGRTWGEIPSFQVALLVLHLEKIFLYFIRFYYVHYDSPLYILLSVTYILMVNFKDVWNIDAPRDTEIQYFILNKGSFLCSSFPDCLFGRKWLVWYQSGMSWLLDINMIINSLLVFNLG